MLLQAFYSISLTGASDLLFRWFVGIGIDDAAWDHSVFSKNRDRLPEGDISAKLLSAILSQPKVRRLLSIDTSPPLTCKAVRTFITIAQALAAKSMRQLHPIG